MDPWAPPLPQQPALGLGAGLAAKGSLVGFGWLVSTGVGRRRGGGALIGLYLEEMGRLPQRLRGGSVDGLKNGIGY